MQPAGSDRRAGNFLGGAGAEPTYPELTHKAGYAYAK